MSPARSAKRKLQNTKLLLVDATSVTHSKIGNLLEYINEGDLLVVNRSGTLPASFAGTVERDGTPIEIRLAAFRGTSTEDLSYWLAVTFGHGSWRNPTEARGQSSILVPGDTVAFGGGLKARIVSVDSLSPRLVNLKFVSENLIADLYERGRPIQYSYLNSELQVWDQQTLFSGPPVSVEPPSAAFPLTWELMLGLKQKGIQLATVLHGAGLSSTGDAHLDLRFPLPEYYEVPSETMERVVQTQAEGGRVIALGTSVVRALESAFSEGSLSSGYTDLRIGPRTSLQAVHSLITGMHESGTSHAQLMQAFLEPSILAQAEGEATRAHYQTHEYGDLTMLQSRSRT